MASQNDEAATRLEEFIGCRPHTEISDDLQVLLTERKTLLDALKRIAKGHTANAEFPSGHIWAADCDACRRQQIALVAIGAAEGPADVG